ncbi:DUF4082 domain-containing protein [Microbacterium sp. NPDC091313]
MGNPTSVVRRSARTRWTAALTLAAVLVSLFTAVPAVVQSAAAASTASSPCGANINAITCENSKPGTSPDVWDISGAGDASIQGFATDISVNAGSTVDFKVDTDASAYTIDIYRTGWYQGLGARKITSVPVTATLPQTQPQCISDQTTELYDCGTWGVSASWNVPADAVSGVYIAKLTRSDTGGASHIIFIVRQDGNTSDVLFQTSDPTWQAYNSYGGADFYQGAANGRAYKISYNRPFATRQGLTARDFYFSSEFATVRFMERNGYDVSYIAGLDTDRRGGELLNHKVFMSVGHDEYWSGAQRANMEAARDAGVNMQFLSGNEGYWRTRYEDSTAGTAGDQRTLVSYKETWSWGKIDPSSQWTGTWRDPRYATQSQGAGLPENALTGTMYMVNDVALPVTVNTDEGNTRLWRNTDLAGMSAGSSVALADQTVGYESDEDVDNGFRPEGLIRLSTTVGDTSQYLRDYGNTVTAGTTTHHVTLYKAASGALVFSAGSIQWGWGLDSTHDVAQPAADPRMQQAQVNLFADMGVQPGSLMSGLVAATRSTDTVAPTTTITSPTAGQTIAHGTAVTVTGTAADTGGQVAGVEVSTDGGDTWHPATGTTTWSYTYIQQGYQQATVIARAIDDSANFSRAGTSVALSVEGPYTVFGAETPSLASSSDTDALELGLKFTPTTDGYVTGVRFYKGANNTGTHTGTLWTSDGQRLATVTFGGESPDGWQTALFTTAVAVTAGTSYVVSYTAPNGGYAYTADYWPYQNTASSPLSVSPTVGAASPGVFAAAGQFPTTTYEDSNYSVDAVFEATPGTTVRLAAQTPAPGAGSVDPGSAVTAVFTGDVTASSVSLTLATAAGASVAGTLSYDPATRTARFAPAAPLAAYTSYTVTLAATAADGSAVDVGVPWTFRTAEAVAPAGQCPCSLYTPLQTPPISSDADSASVTVGTRFTVSQAGVITGIRFYKGRTNTGTHVGTVWDASGTALGSATFTDETASGWQTATLAQPISVQPGQTYTVSYVAPAGNYAVGPSEYASSFTRGPLTVPAQGGAFTYNGGFPSNSSATSYYVDVVFQQSAQGPALLSTTPASGATAVAADTSISATFDSALTSTPTVTVTAGSTTVAGTTSLSSDRTTVTFAPAAALPSGASVTVRLTGLASASGTGADRSWSFQTASPTPAAVSFFGTGTPTATASNDGTSVELGLRFTTSVAGQVTALKFYKASGDTATHTGTLWAPDGTALATVTFQSESASGWQRAVLSTPVALTPGQTYTVSYLSPQGRYVATSNAFTSAVSSGPLTAVSPNNGTYRYGAGGTMPSSSWRSSNYYVDVEFTPGSGSTPAVSVQSKTPTGASVATSTAISATLSADATSPTLQLNQGSTAVAGTSAYASSTRTISFSPAAALTAATTYTAVVRIGGQVLDQWTFTTAAPDVPGSTDTLFGTQTPSVTAATDTAAVELGTAFTVARAGTVTALRFYKGVGNTGTHVASLWNAATGERLATVTFGTETASGWQRAALSQPVAVTTGTTYIASYLAPNGRYAITPQFFTSSVTNGSITAPGGSNGRFLYGAAGGMPTGSWNSSAYFVDAEIVFGSTSPSPSPSASASPSPSTSPSPSPSASASPSPSPSASASPSPSPSASASPSPSASASPTPAPTAAASAQSPAGGATDVPPTATVTVTLQPAPAAASLGLTGPQGAVPGTSTYDAATGKLLYTPTDPLGWSTAYTATVTSPSATVTGGSWSFTTAAQPPVVAAQTIFGNATPQNPWWADPDGVQVATRFSVSAAGTASGVRFYKGDANTGQHTGYLWDSTGKLLAQVEFVNETASGWQTAQFSTPIQLTPGTEYRVGLYSTTGRYAVDLGGLAGATQVGVFSTPANGSAYTYSRNYPAQTSSHNYWVDIVFDATG